MANLKCQQYGRDPIEALEGHVGRISALAYQRRGHLLASGAQDASVMFWNAGKS